MRYFIVNYRQVMVRQGPKMQPQTDEIVSVSKKVRRSDSQTAAVILDFKTRTVVQASMNGVTVPKDFEKIRNFYHQHYSKIIEDLESFYAINDKDPAQAQ
jgi:hypothetical protein